MLTCSSADAGGRASPVHETVAFIKEFRKLAGAVHDVEIVVARPFTALRGAVEAHAHPEGALASGSALWRPISVMRCVAAA